MRSFIKNDTSFLILFKATHYLRIFIIAYFSLSEVATTFLSPELEKRCVRLL